MTRAGRLLTMSHAPPITSSSRKAEHPAIDVLALAAAIRVVPRVVADAWVDREAQFLGRRGRAGPQRGDCVLTRWTEEREWTEPWANGKAARGEHLRFQAFQQP